MAAENQLKSVRNTTTGMAWMYLRIYTYTHTPREGDLWDPRILDDVFEVVALGWAGLDLPSREG